MKDFPFIKWAQANKDFFRYIVYAVTLLENAAGQYLVQYRVKDLKYM